jgi:hypothetical protein
MDFDTIGRRANEASQILDDGLELFSRGLVDDALNQYNKAQRIIDLQIKLSIGLDDVTRSRLSWLKGEIYTIRSVVHLKMRNNTLALDDANVGVDLLPDYPLAYYNRAMPRINLKDLSGAISDLSRCIHFSAQPDVECLIKRSYVYFRLFNHMRCQSDFDSANNIDQLQASQVPEYSDVANFLATHRAPTGHLITFSEPYGGPVGPMIAELTADNNQKYINTSSITDMVGKILSTFRLAIVDGESCSAKEREVQDVFELKPSISTVGDEVFVSSNSFQEFIVAIQSASVVVNEESGGSEGVYSFLGICMAFHILTVSVQCGNSKLIRMVSRNLALIGAISAFVERSILSFQSSMGRIVPNFCPIYRLAPHILCPTHCRDILLGEFALTLLFALKPYLAGTSGDPGFLKCEIYFRIK